MGRSFRAALSAAVLAIAASVSLADQLNAPALDKRWVRRDILVDPTEGASCVPTPCLAPGCMAITPAGHIWDCDGNWHERSSGGSSSVENYSQSIAAVTTVTLTHALGTRNLLVECYDATDKKVEPNTITIGGSPSYDITVTFFVAQTGRCVVNGRN